MKGENLTTNDAMNIEEITNLDDAVSITDEMVTKNIIEPIAEIMKPISKQLDDDAYLFELSKKNDPSGFARTLIEAGKSEDEVSSLLCSYYYTRQLSDAITKKNL